MQGWRRYTIIGVLAFLVGVAVWLSMAWSDTINFDVPKGQTAPPPVKFDCGHLFGSLPPGGAKVMSANAYNNLSKLSHKPCSGRTGRRVLVFVDAAAGAA